MSRNSSSTQDPDSTNQCGEKADSNNKYLNHRGRHQQRTTKSRTLAELYRCKRKAESRFGDQQVGNKPRQHQETCRHQCRTPIVPISVIPKRPVRNDRYLNCRSRHQQQTTKSRTLAELYRCKREAESRFGCIQVGNRPRQCQETCRHQCRTTTGVQWKTQCM